MVAGFHVPAMFSFDVAGSVGAVVPTQIEVGIVGNVSVTLFVTVMCTVVGLAHVDPDGVNI